jgi:hypothetical protein
MAKKRNLNRLLSLFLTLAMLFSLTVGLGGAAWAAEDDAPELSIEDVYAPDGEQNDAEPADGDSDAEEPKPPETSGGDTETPEYPEIPDASDPDAPEPLNDGLDAAPKEPLTIGADYHITTVATYRIDPGAINGTIYVDVAGTVANPVVLVGNGSASTATPNSALTIVCTVTGTRLRLQNLWISSPFRNGNVINFTGTGNTLSVADGSTAILESVGENNGAVIHVGPSNALTITGSATSNLYVYKDSVSAAIGGDTGQASGAITFASGNIFLKGSGLGAVVGGDDTIGLTTNGVITISGGLLCIEANARGAAIGASNRGECAGDVYITGGTTRIDVYWTGSAIGRGESGWNRGRLFVTGGTLDVFIGAAAAAYWRASGHNNAPITADKYYDTARESDVAAVLMSSYVAPQQITATFTPDGATSSIQLYNALGFNQYDYVGDTTPPPDYTPNNWANNISNRTLYLYLPTSPATGEISVTLGTSAPQLFAYTYNPTSGFAVTPVTKYSFAISAPSGTTVYDTSLGGTITSLDVYEEGSSYFTVVPASGTAAASATDATVTALGNGIFEISDPTDAGTITITVTGSNAVYPVTFSGTNEYTKVGDVAAKIVTVDGGASLDFTVTPDYGYGVGAVTASSGAVTPNSDGSYTLSGVTAAATVTIPTTQTFRTVTFSGDGAVVTVGGTPSTTASVPDGGVLFFKVAPYLGYIVTEVTVDGLAIPVGPDGYYMLSGVTADTTVTVTTSADTSSWLGQAASAYAGGAGSAANPYQIATGGQLALLASEVLGGNSHGKDYFVLTANIDLTGYSWVPIGGGRVFNTVSGVPGTGTPAFGGTFDGAGYTVSNLSINPSSFVDGLGAIGLFGYVDGGLLMDFTVDGAITLSDSAYAVAGAVGFTTGEIYRVTNSVDVTVSGARTTWTGGVAGVVSNPGSLASLYVEYCVNDADIAGRSRLGGVVGETRATYTGGVTVDQSYNTGDISAEDSEGRSYVGGVVGYSMGYILNCYNTGDITTGTGNIYAGGVVGLLNGAGAPFASLQDSFNTGIVDASASEGYGEPLWGYSDNSLDVIVSNCIYINDGGVTQYVDTRHNTLATDTNVEGVASSVMGSAAAISPTRLSSTYFEYVSGANPTLIWQRTGTVFGPIYLDPNAAAGGDGSYSNPFNDLRMASDAQSAARSTVYILGGVSVDHEVNLNASADVERVIRHGATGDLITIVTRGQVNITQGAVDGNGGAAGSLFNVSGGTLNVSGGSLQNNVNSALASNGGGVYIGAGGTFNLTEEGLVTRNSATNGGGVYSAGSAPFDLSGGKISGNTATNGGGVYVASGSGLTLTKGSIANNTATSGGGVFTAGATSATGGVIGGADVYSENVATNGGGAYVDAGGTFTLDDGAITYNRATAGGGGVYVAETGAFTLTLGSISDNTAPDGGGVNTSGTLTLNGGVVSYNKATTGSGGGVYIGGGTTTVSGTAAISYNSLATTSTNGRGGGIFKAVVTATLTMSGGTIDHNTAIVAGGVYIIDSVSGGAVPGGTTLSGTDIEYNTANNAGGVYVSGNGVNSFFEITGGSISNNSAPTAGGLYLSWGRGEMSGGEISYNTVTQTSGGGVYVNSASSQFNMSGGSMNNNSAPSTSAGNGGGIYLSGGTINLSGTAVISDNTARGNGGGVYAGGAFNMSGGTITGNTATGNGGGSYVSASGITYAISGGVIEDNTATLGGGIYFAVGTANISGITITGNTATTSGGGIYMQTNAIVNITGITVVGNTASMYGNGIYYQYTNRLTISPASNAVFNIADEIYVTNNVRIVIGASLSGITGDLNIRTAASPSTSVVLAGAATGYTLTAADTQKIYYANTDDYSVTLSGTTAVLAASVFMDGSAAVDGNGTRTNPFNNVRSALGESKNLLPVIMIGGPTVISAADLDLSGDIYEGAVFRRGIGYTGILFSVAAGDSAQVSGVFIKGTKQYVPASTGSIFQLPGALTLNSGAVLENNRATNGGAIIIDKGGSVNITGGTISGNTASLGNGIYVTASNALTLTPSGANTIAFGGNDDIYLPSMISFNIDSDLNTGVSGTIAIVFEDPFPGDTVASTLSSTMASNSIGSLSPQGGITLAVIVSDIVIDIVPNRSVPRL